jgi:hypothetical protein
MPVAPVAARRPKMPVFDEKMGIFASFLTICNPHIVPPSNPHYELLMPLPLKPRCTPATIARKLNGYEEAGVNYVLLKPAPKLEGLEAFGEKVLPQLGK